MKLPVTIAALLALAACASSETRFWTIEPVAATAPPVSRAIPPVQVAAVHVPLAIDRLEIVQHDADERVTVNDFDRWSAPPGDLIRRALTQDLVARLPGGSVIYPDVAAPRGTRAIVVDILDLRRTAEGFVMDASWSSVDPAVPAGARHRQLRLSAPAGAGDVAAQTQAIGRIVAQLADAIAQGL